MMNAFGLSISINYIKRYSNTIIFTLVNFESLVNTLLSHFFQYSVAAFMMLHSVIIRP